MDTYPQADYETFFNAPLDSITYRGLASSIKEMLDYSKNDIQELTLRTPQN